MISIFQNSLNSTGASESYCGLGLVTAAFIGIKIFLKDTCITTFQIDLALINVFYLFPLSKFGGYNSS